jgi:hypothetical protein
VLGVRSRAKFEEEKAELLFESIVELPRIKHGNKQTVETLINEEALLLAKYLRNEKQTWIPRTPFLTSKSAV